MTSSILMKTEHNVKPKPEMVESQSAFQREKENQTQCCTVTDNSQCSTISVESHSQNEFEQNVDEATDIKPPKTNNVLHDRTNGKKKTKSVAVNTTVSLKVATPKSKRSKNSYRKKLIDDGTNRKVTDYFPLRRSARQVEAESKIDRFDIYRDRIADEAEPNLCIIHDDVKGRGISADKVFERRDFVCEYRGDLLTKDEAIKREKNYSMNDNIGSYMYYFNYKGKKFCVDATAETKYLGRLANHSRCKANCKMTIVDGHDGKPHVCLIANRLIRKGSEILYDYGDRSKQALEANPWLKY